jgi:hypothetical protein
MKKFMFSGLLTLALGMMSFTVSAQCCKKSSAEKAACSSAGKTVQTEKSEAMLVAMQDQNVEEKLCSTSGTASYYIKVDNVEAGPAQEVAFDAKIGRFVNASPKKACCSKDEAKSCANKNSGKACCDKGKAELKS